MESQVVTITLSEDEYYMDHFYIKPFNDVFDWERPDIGLCKDNELFSGRIIMKFHTGKIFYDFTWLNGLREGVAKIYYINGNLKQEINYSKDKMQGAFISYYENGYIKSSSEMKDDLVNGKEIEYYSTEKGRKKSEGMAIQRNMGRPTMKQGHWIYYYENGQKKEEGAWASGGRHGDMNVKSGEWKYYDEKGQLIKTEKYNESGFLQETINE
jgi:antitoxin component YwqK of YwqJK toxin-antitoxin module